MKTQPPPDLDELEAQLAEEWDKADLFDFYNLHFTRLISEIRRLRRVCSANEKHPISPDIFGGWSSDKRWYSLPRGYHGNTDASGADRGVDASASG